MNLRCPGSGRRVGPRRIVRLESVSCPECLEIVPAIGTPKYQGKRNPVIVGYTWVVADHYDTLNIGKASR